jgi:hypothetical protein
MRYSQAALPLSAAARDEHRAFPPPACSTSTGPTTASFFLTVSQTFRKCDIAVLPAVAQPSESLPSDTLHKRNRLAEMYPPPPEAVSSDNLLESPLRLRPSAPKQAVHPWAIRAALRAGIRQQAARILEGISGSSLTTIHKAPDTLAQRGEEIREDTHAGKEESLERALAVLASSHLWTEEGGRQQCHTLQRTMLACEGIAINSLFDYGMLTCRV